MRIMKHKISYLKKWDSKGTVYNQTIAITEKELAKIQAKHLTEFVKNEKDIDGKIDYYYKLYLGSPNDCERLNSIVFTNHTQNDFFVKILGIKSKRLKNRNTCYMIV